MLHTARVCLTAAAALFLASLAGVNAGGDDLVDHPLYVHWANCKPGSTATLVEKTVFSGPDKDQVPDGIDEKVIVRKLVSVSPKNVVVQSIVAENDFLGLIEAAPTKATY